MTYELAKKLNEAGFKLRLCESGSDWKGEHIFKMADGLVYFAPTLSELIEACGENFSMVMKHDDGRWSASTKEPYNASLGSNYEEAVANLWLVINKKL